MFGTSPGSSLWSVVPDAVLLKGRSFGLPVSLLAVRLRGRVGRMPSVLVTGAARGIGRAAALRMANLGWEVYAGVRTPADGEDLASAAPQGRITPVLLDVTDAAQLAALDGVLGERLDAVINNAGIGVSSPLEGVRLDELRRQFEVNVVGPVAVTQAVLPRLRASRGRVIFISSVSGRVSSPLMGPYSASKYALEALADSLRIELRPWGVSVALIEPGAIDTDLWRHAPDMVDAAEAQLSDGLRVLYRGHFVGARATVNRIQKQTAPVEKVVEAIEKALTSPKPRARYVVGTDARIQLAMQGVLPTSAMDAAVAKLTGTPGSL